MEIGILGLTFKSGNKGCEALSYSFVEILNEIAKGHAETITVNLLVPFPTRLWMKNSFSINQVKRLYYPEIPYSNVSFDVLFYIYKNKRIKFLNSIKQCNYVFDYTAGDSFTDIYGLNRFYTRTRCKLAVITKGVPLILGSQAIGPFHDKNACDLAVEVLQRCREVYVRDELSAAYTKEISGREAKLTSDIAFALPYERKAVHEESKKIKIGFNPSGLLWSGGYTGDNQFDLTVDYQVYCKEIINRLRNKYEIHLVPHAFTNDLKSKDNDFIAMDSLAEEFPDMIRAPAFKTPMEIKSYIAGLDIFIGARMHAAIGAFSANVPVIPFSYSRKFEGLFNSLNYEYVIHGKGQTTAEAVERTLDFVTNKDVLKLNMQPGREKARNSIKYITQELEHLFYIG